MSYQVIARKWRPQTFDEVTGQEVIMQTLRNAIVHDRLHHAYLFSGARGVGKTTSARILAKALNCHKFDAPTATPCKFDSNDICPSCLEIAESRSIDVLEIDAASHTGIGDVRETILDSINFNPARDRYKVFIIDEVHQLSKPAFNALLKTLEEPPPKVLFVMATTELHKVPDTILSRCQEFEFRTIPVQKIRDRLRLIADAEKIDVEEQALTEIARSGLGSMRDAQSNFDQVISFSSEKITSIEVSRALGIAGVDTLTNVTNAIIASDRQAMLMTVDDLISRGHDLRNFCQDLISFFRDLLVQKVAGDSDSLLEGSALPAEDLASIAEKFSSADLIRFFNSICKTETELRDATHSRYVLEIGLVKLIEFASIKPIEEILSDLEKIEQIPGMFASTPIAVEPEPSKTADDATAVDLETAGQEKKTSEIADVSELPPFRDFDELDSLMLDDPEPLPTRIWVEPPAWLTADPEFLPALPLEFAEHFDEPRLDERYDRIIERIDDIAGPLPTMTAWLEDRFRKYEPKPQPVAVATPVPSVDLDLAIPTYDDEPDVALPDLRTGASDDELLQYANAHPDVRRIKRLFRAEVIDVRPSISAKHAAGRK